MSTLNKHQAGAIGDFLDRLNEASNDTGVYIDTGIEPVRLVIDGETVYDLALTRKLIVGTDPDEGEDEYAVKVTG